MVSFITREEASGPIKERFDRLDEDGDGIPDEDEYQEMEDEITQVIDRRANVSESALYKNEKMNVTRRQLRQMISEEILNFRNR